MELIYCSQNLVGARVLPIAEISCSFVACAAMQTLTQKSNITFLLQRTELSVHFCFSQSVNHLLLIDCC